MIYFAFIEGGQEPTKKTSVLITRKILNCIWKICFGFKDRANPSLHHLHLSHQGWIFVPRFLNRLSGKYYLLVKRKPRQERGRKLRLLIVNCEDTPNPIISTSWKSCTVVKYTAYLSFLFCLSDNVTTQTGTRGMKTYNEFNSIHTRNIWWKFCTEAYCQHHWNRNRRWRRSKAECSHWTPIHPSISSWHSIATAPDEFVGSGWFINVCMQIWVSHFWQSLIG